MFSTHCTNLKATVAGLSLTPTMDKVKIRKEEGCSYSQSQLECRLGLARLAEPARGFSSFERYERAGSARHPLIMNPAVTGDAVTVE